jgi:hypothetical protein
MPPGCRLIGGVTSLRLIPPTPLCLVAAILSKAKNADSKPLGQTVRGKT